MTAKSTASPIAWLETDEVLYVAQLPQGPLIVLTGTSAAVWLEVQRAGLAGVAERLADAFRVPVEAIENDVTGCVAGLAELGVLADPGASEPW